MMAGMDKFVRKVQKEIGQFPMSEKIIDRINWKMAEMHPDSQTKEFWRKVEQEQSVSII